LQLRRVREGSDRSEQDCGHRSGVRVLVGVAERGVVVLVGLEWRRGIGGGVIGLARIRPLGRLYGVIIVGVGVLVAVLRHVDLLSCGCR
jgi:hypothetical protein